MKSIYLILYLIGLIFLSCTTQSDKVTEQKDFEESYYKPQLMT